MDVKITAPPSAMAVLDIEVEGPRIEVPRMRLHAGLERPCPDDCKCKEEA